VTPMGKEMCVPEGGLSVSAPAIKVKRIEQKMMSLVGMGREINFLFLIAKPVIIWLGSDLVFSNSCPLGWNIPCC
jgi:hypothetical protein